MIQLFMALFGLSAMYMSLGNDPVLRQWAPVVGLMAQPFWAWFSWEKRAWGVGVQVLAYTAVYMRGIYLHWMVA